MSGALQIFVNGEACSGGWPLDRSLQYGDGLFETMRARGGRIRFEALHRARLAEGCRRLGIAFDAALVWEPVVAAAQSRGDALLRLQLTRGDAIARGYAPTGREAPRAILSVFEAPRDGEIPAEVRVHALAHTLGENPLLAGLKHCNRLEQVLARQAMRGSGAYEGLMASSSGLLISGTMSNVFIELDGELMTPALDRCGVAGVMRGVALREAAATGVEIRIAGLRWDVLARCTSLAISNARLGLLPVHLLDGRSLAASARLAQLASRLESLDE
jgi:4-amino-4-deoxychorismate lyase